MFYFKLFIVHKTVLYISAQFISYWKRTQKFWNAEETIGGHNIFNVKYWCQLYYILSSCRCCNYLLTLTLFVAIVLCHCYCHCPAFSQIVRDKFIITVSEFTNTSLPDNHFKICFVLDLFIHSMYHSAHSLTFMNLKVLFYRPLLAIRIFVCHNPPYPACHQYCSESSLYFLFNIQVLFVSISIAQDYTQDV